MGITILHLQLGVNYILNVLLLNFRLRFFYQPIFFFNPLIPYISEPILSYGKFATTVSPEMYKCKFLFHSAVYGLYGTVYKSHKSVVSLQF